MPLRVTRVSASRLTRVTSRLWTGTAVPSSIKAHDRLFGKRTSIQGVNPRGEAVSSRMAGAPAQEEIDEPADKFLRPRSDIAHLELLA